MIKFSVENQIFYDLTFNYSELPDNLIDVPDDQFKTLLDVRDRGCRIFADLTYSDPKPNQFHKWNGTDWVDPRTPEEIEAYNRSIMPNLTPIEFEIKLYKAGLYDAVKDYIENKASVPVRIAYSRATFFSRTDPFIATAMRDLNLTDEEVDAVWIGG